MKRRLFRWSLWSLGVLPLVGGGVFGLLWALEREPAFYRQALAIAPGEQRAANEELLAHAGALASDVRRDGEWHVLVTADEINGWLAVDRVENHPELLPPSVIDPRVSIETGEAQIAFRLETGTVSTVVSATVEVYAAEPNTIAVRLRKVRAGALPAPMGGVLEKITEAAAEMNLAVRWLLSGSDPVALVTLPTSGDGEDKRHEIDVVELREGAVYISGRTSTPDDRALAESTREAAHAVHSSNDAVQR